MLPTLLDYQKMNGKLPKLLSFSLAALIAFYRNENGIGKGRINAYPVSDSPGFAAFFEAQWKTNGGDLATLTDNVLKCTDFWGENLNAVPGLAAAVTQNLKNIVEKGVRLTIGELING